MMRYISPQAMIRSATLPSGTFRPHDESSTIQQIIEIWSYQLKKKSEVKSPSLNSQFQPIVFYNVILFIGKHWTVYRWAFSETYFFLVITRMSGVKKNFEACLKVILHRIMFFLFFFIVDRGTYVIKEHFIRHHVNSDPTRCKPK